MKDELAPRTPLEAFTQAAAIAISDAWGRLTLADRERLDQSVDAGLIVGYSLRLEVDTRRQRPVVIFELIRADGIREPVQTSSVGTFLSRH